MLRYIDRGGILTGNDSLHTEIISKYLDLSFQRMPEIISFTDFLRWNYTVDYGSYIRNKHHNCKLMLPYGVKKHSHIVNVAIVDGKYDRIDAFSFLMYVICDVCFDNEGYLYHQEYCVNGYFRTYGSSDFLNDVKLYNGERIRCRNPLDQFLVPIMTKHAFDTVADEILDQYYDKERDYIYKINGIALAKAMGYDIQYLRLSLSGKIKSKLLFDKKDVAVYDKDGHKVIMHIPANTIIVDKSLIDSPELDYVLIHECVHVRLHYLFYYIQSLYRRGNGKEMPEFLDYFYSETQKDCIRWMETQANSIARRIQMPKGDTTDVILEFMDHHDEMSFDDCRELIDHVKNKFGVSRYAAKKRIVELGWTEVRGVYVYCTTGYVEDHEIEDDFPMDYTYTLPLKCIAEIYGSSSDFAALVSSRKYIYIDGHLCCNDEKYVIKEYGVAFGLTEYAKHHMAECCLSFKRFYEKQEYSYTYGELNKEDLQLIVEHTLDNEQKKKLRKALKEHSKEDIKLQRNSGSNPFAEAVKFHMKRCKVTVETLAERSGLGLTTIGRMRKGGKFKIETILAFSVALELEMPFIVDLMQKAGVQFNPHNPVHNMYLTILDLLPDANVFQINAFLKEEGFTPWTQEREQKQYESAV